MKPPLVPDQPPEVLRDEELKKLLKVCEGSDFVSRRDTAIIRLLIDSGMRRSEISGLKVSDVHFDQGVAIVLGKNRKPRACPFGKKTAQALDRYLRTRSAHPDADGESLGYSGSPAAGQLPWRSPCCELRERRGCPRGQQGPSPSRGAGQNGRPCSQRRWCRRRLRG
jgi:integrase